MYQYWGFGLHILSEIEFPELVQFLFSNAPDLTIHLGVTPKILTGQDVVHKVRVSISPTEYLLNQLNVANYYATKGDTITIEPVPGADDKSIRLFMLGSVMAAILRQRDWVPLHAAAIEYHDGVVLFCGPTGVGKSTLVSMLHQKGYKVFSDEFVVLRSTNLSRGGIEIVPTFPVIRLWKDSFAKLGLDVPDDKAKVRPQLAKYSCFNHDGFNVDSKPVKHIFILDKKVQFSEPKINEMGPGEAFGELHKNMYMPVQLEPMKKESIHFFMLSQLANSCAVCNLTRPSGRNSIASMCTLIEKKLSTNE